MLNRTGFSLIELALVVVIIGVIATISIPNYLAMQARAKEADVIGCAHAVQMAAENHAVRSGGIYSDLEADIRPFLPYGLLLINAFSGDRTEPQFGSVAATPGQVGIVVVIQNGIPVGYTISGFGRNDIVISYTGGV
jgi:prepilin-type N-terminal cleavage/methylation domain-containing protein